MVWSGSLKILYPQVSSFEIPRLTLRFPGFCELLGEFPSSFLTIGGFLVGVGDHLGF